MQTTPMFGPLAWAFYTVQALGVAVGVYLIFLTFAWKDAHSFRKKKMGQLGMLLLVVGGIGVAFGLLRLMNIEPLNQPLWFYGLAAVELLLGASILYYSRAIYPRHAGAATPAKGGQRSQGSQQRRRTAAASSSAKQSSGNAGRSEERNGGEEESSASTSRTRRESRRERKRKRR